MSTYILRGFTCTLPFERAIVSSSSSFLSGSVVIVVAAVDGDGK